MKSFKTTALLAGIGLLVSFGTSRADDGPLSCRYSRQRHVLDCDVLIDDANVSQIVLNRGQCPVVKLTPENREGLRKSLRPSLMMEQLLAHNEILLSQPSTYDPAAAGQFGDWRPGQDVLDMDDSNALVAALYYLALDPTGDYKFGNKLSMHTRDCNLLEWTITVNGQDWTWKAE